MNFHNIKMNDINVIIKELWLNTYCGTGACNVSVMRGLGGGREVALRDVHGQS